MPQSPNLFAIIYDALLRPTQFLAFLDGGRRNMRWAALATSEMLAVTLGFIALVLGQLIRLGPPGLIAGLGYAPLMALMIAGICIIVGSDSSFSPLVNAAFWAMRCLIAITPPLAIFLAVAFSNTFSQLQRSPSAILLLLFLVGAWLGGALTVMLIRRRRQTESAVVRWVIAGGSLTVGGALWLSPALRTTEALLFIPWCAGLAAGVLRPLSYLWEAPLSVGLLLAAKLGFPTGRLLPLHPAMYDELCLLPLPGLSRLLARACTRDLDEGGDWMLRVAYHPGQGYAVRRAIEHIVRGGHLTHPLLFYLSTTEEGVGLLRDMVERAQIPHPLIAAYASLASITAPEAWADAIAGHREAIVHAIDLPGAPALLALLDAGAGTLRADRWPAAIDGLRATSPPRGVEEDAIWVALEIVQTWASDRLPALVTERAAALRSLWVELEDLEGWPAALIAAMSEHLLFLLSVEQRRGAWLV
jgi:hypothetical protein